VLVVGNPAIAYGAGVGAAATMGLYACGRSKVSVYSPVLLVLVSGGPCDFFTTFRIGIF